MDTVKEAARKNARKTSYLYDFPNHNQAIECFSDGVEFAQQWYSVENELPEKYYEPVIVKDKKGNLDKAVLTGIVWCFENEKTRVKNLPTGDQ